MEQAMPECDAKCVPNAFWLPITWPDQTGAGAAANWRLSKCLHFNTHRAEWGE